MFKYLFNVAFRRGEGGMATTAPGPAVYWGP